MINKITIIPYEKYLFLKDMQKKNDFSGDRDQVTTKLVKTKRETHKKQN